MYKYDLSKLLLGDILLERYLDKTSILICETSKSNYSHALLYVDDSSVIEAGDTVEANNLSRHLIEDKDTVCALRLKPEFYDEGLISCAIIHARRLVFTAYSKSEARQTMHRPKGAKEPNRQICTRLIAQSYEAAGISLVENADYCTIRELEDSNKLYVLKNILVKATEEDIEFADSPNVLINQAEIQVQLMKSVSKILCEDVQTLEQLSRYVVVHQDKADVVADVVKASGYLDMWKLEKDYNPHFYNPVQFAKKFANDIEAAAIQTIYANDKLEITYQQNLRCMQEGITLYGKNAYFDQMIELYEKLLELCTQRTNVAITARDQVMDANGNESV